MEGIIVKIISNLYSVLVDKKVYECRARGKFRNEDISPMVGDNVVIDENNYILEIKSRKNFLDRPVIANIDYAIIVSSLKHPDFSFFLLDKMLTNIYINDIKPIICFTKYDLLNSKEKKEVEKIITYYKNLGIPVIINKNYKKLGKILKGKIVVLCGQTGAGKSTLLNRMIKGLDLKTDEISNALGRGKHTTRHVELFKYKQSLIADTPGFSAFDVEKNENLKFMFKEFLDCECKFRDCKHIDEEGCMVKEKVKNGLILKSRYDSYRKMVLK